MAKDAATLEADVVEEEDAIDIEELQMLVDVNSKHFADSAHREKVAAANSKQQQAKPLQAQISHSIRRPEKKKKKAKGAHVCLSTHARITPTADGKKAGDRGSTYSTWCEPAWQRSSPWRARRPNKSPTTSAPSQGQRCRAWRPTSRWTGTIRTSFPTTRLVAFTRYLVMAVWVDRRQ